MLATRIWLLLGTMAWMPVAFAQSTLGALLDAGAKPLPPDQFKEELVQRTIVGPTFTGVQLELMYVGNGTVQGTGVNPYSVSNPSRVPQSIDGEWTVDEKGRICVSMRIGSQVGTFTILPARCQYWFKLGTQYFLADSDTDRSAKVLSRTIKQ